MKLKIENIATNEKLQLDSEIISKIISNANGDLRKGIMILQNINYIYDKSTESDIDGTIDQNLIYDIMNSVPNEFIDNIINKCIDVNSTIQDVIESTNTIVAKGYSAGEVLQQTLNIILSNDKIHDNHKSLICVNIANTERKLLEGADEYLQLLNIFSYIKGITNNIINYYPNILT